MTYRGGGEQGPAAPRAEGGADKGTTPGSQYRFYIVLDLSRSMGTRPASGGASPDEKLREVIPRLVSEVAYGMPTVALQAWLSVITFNDHAKVIQPLTAAGMIDKMPALPEVAGWTDLAAALNFVADRIERDANEVRLPPGRTWSNHPVVFLLTDGHPEVEGKRQTDEAWQAPRQRLTTSQHANIVTLGFRGADERVLWEVATNGDQGAMAYVADGTMNPEQLLPAISDAIVSSIAFTAGKERLIFDLPSGMREAKH